VNDGYPYRGDEATLAIAEQERSRVPPPGPPPPVPPPDDRDVWPWLLALLVLVLVLVGAGAAYALTRDRGHKSAQTVVITRAVSPAKTTPAAAARKPLVKRVAVPNVVGMPIGKAVSALAKAGLVPQPRPVASTKPKGTVVSEQPSAQSKLARGAKVILGISNGPPLAVVPSAVGQPEQTAIASLTALGLKANVVQVPSAQAKGTVVAQYPRSGTKVRKSSRVRLNVASGAKPPTPTTTHAAPKAAPATPPGPAKQATVRVPDVNGLKLRAAQSAIRTAGLVTEIRNVPSTFPAGTVTGQSPKPGATAKRGDHVFVTVSEGGSAQQLKVVPDVVGQDAASARQTLEAAGFVVEEVDQPTTDESQDGVVVAEQPKAGTKAPDGSDVTVSIGRYSPTG